MKRFILFLFLAGLSANAAPERKVDADFVQHKHQSPAPGNPPTGYSRFYFKTDGKPYYKSALGIEVELFSTASVLGLANGGTNKNITPSAGALIYSDSDSFELSGIGTAGQAVISGGTSAPQFFNPTEGSLLFAGTSGALAQDNASLFFDNLNNRLGILTTSPAASFDLAGDLAMRFSSDASAGDIDALAAAGKGAIRLTGAVINLRGIDNGVNGKIIVLKNATGGAITIKNDNANPSAEDRILTGTGADITINNGGAFIVAYDATTQRWSVIGGAGSGGGGGGGGISRTVGGTRGSPLSITAVGGISFSATGDEDQYIQGSGGPVDISANPQIQAGTVDGQRLCLIGRSNDNTVFLESGNGLSLNGSVDLMEDDTLCVRWDGSNWVEVSRNI